MERTELGPLQHLAAIKDLLGINQSRKLVWPEDSMNELEQRSTTSDNSDASKMKKVGVPLSYVPPEEVEGRKVAMVQKKAVLEPEAEYWSTSVISFVLGANPLFQVMDRFYRQLWKQLTVEKVVLLPTGLYLIRFTSIDARDEAMKVPVYHMSANPIGVKLWDQPPLVAHFVDELGMVREKPMFYEWKPTQFIHCKNFGHGEENYGKKHTKVVENILKEIGAQGSVARQELSRSFASFFKKPDDVSIRKDSLIKEISKISHKDSECRIGQPLQWSKDVEPRVVKKKGIKLAPSKPKRSFKKGSGKPGLDVEILNLNPLIGKGIEPEVMESSVPSSCPVETLDARNMFSALQGLDEGDIELPLEKDKSAIATALFSKILPPTVTTNHFAALEMIEEGVNKVVSVEGEEYVEDVYIESPPTQHELQNDTEIAGKVSKPVEMEDVDSGVWSDGDADNVHVTGSVQGDGSVHKRRGRKSKEEKAKMQGVQGELAPRRTSKIWVFSQHEFSVTMLEEDVQVFHFEVSHANVAEKFYLSAVYAKTTRLVRQSLWRNLIAFRQKYANSPWMVAKDFNVIQSLDEYSGVSVQDHVAISEFNDCIFECNLLEFPTTGEEFTWAELKVQDG
ncbi:OLC1v1016120C1 [Oldenlandia corymbosa var. corymbosa]|uniref:OLC1v1016120C1 n=1 Tax=Oldenlandia corymbosa var. corymbosa TaxID=529605 RepID=A0AAV1E6Q7_OLDCO|nr:OLC1v1016120C1 [Oldenlandia corymbosa var. corymbosa]